MEDYLNKTRGRSIIGLNIYSSLEDNSIKEYSLLEYKYNPFVMYAGGYIDNIKDEIDLNIGFDIVW